MVGSNARIWRAAGITLALVWAVASVSRGQSVVVDTAAGKIEGTRQTIDGTKEIVFRSIPYAAPPVGELRWQAPQPAKTWPDVRKARPLGPACVQPKAEGIAETSEDCLTLNIWAPQREGGQRLPVMVWIHGGGFRIGSGSLAMTDGGWLAKRKVIVVTLNYRMGFLGFFGHPALNGNSGDTPLNFGLLDQIAALQWVRDNISGFGGDPGNVTIFGQSAGAISVEYLMASPLAKGLFAKAIAQSGGGWLKPSDRATAIALGGKVAAALGLNGESATASQLRALPASRLQEAALTMSGGPDFGPIIGDAAVPRTLEEAFGKGLEAPVPLIVGTVSYEASIMKEFQVSNERVIAALGSDAPRARAIYGPKLPDAKLAPLLLGDAMGTAPARWMAQQHSQRAPTWNYYFDHVPWLIRRKAPGTAHGADILYIFDSWRSTPMKGKLTLGDRKLVKTMGDCWTAFAASSAPVCGGAPAWPTFTAANPLTMEFAKDNVVRTDLLKARLDFQAEREEQGKAPYTPIASLD